ncbi:CDP-alcohol phosphatidyltransferase family protein [soil metagenome]
MLDAPVRRALEPSLDAVAAALARLGVRAIALTIAGWLVGAGACVLAATGHWHLALVGWLLNRVLDGLDGPLARQTGSTDLGGFLDIVADFSIYGGFVVAAAIAEPDARVACLALLGTYYLSGTAFLALSSVLERRGQTERSDGRSLLFVGGLAEGTETVLAYVAICLFPQHLAVIAWVFAAAVGITALQRIALGIHLLRGAESLPRDHRPFSTEEHR